MVHERAPFWRSKSGLVALAFAAIAAFLLLTEHASHLWGALPYLLILACPLMHLFHHHDHGKAQVPSPSREDRGS